MRTILTFAAGLVVLLATLLASEVADARSCHSHKGCEAAVVTQAAATCSVAPNPVQRFADVIISGSGFRPNGVVGITIQGGLGLAVTGQNSDETGSFTLLYHTVWLGTNTVTAHTGSLSLGTLVIATCTFETFD